MKNKLKKNKPHLVFIYGFISVGKLTVAKELAKITKYKILHNHIILDFVSEFFENKKPWHWDFEKADLREWLHFELTKKILKSGNSFIFTHAYSDSYRSTTGMTDFLFVKNIEKIVKNSGAVFCPVYLSCKKSEMLKRVNDESRKSFNKLISKKIMKDLLSKSDYQKPAPIKNNLIINTTNITPKKSASMIKKHFNLR